MAVEVGVYVGDDVGNWVAVTKRDDPAEGAPALVVINDQSEAADVYLDAAPAVGIAILKHCDPEAVRDAAAALGLDLKALAGGF